MLNIHWWCGDNQDRIDSDLMVVYGRHCIYLKCLLFT